MGPQGQWVYTDQYGWVWMPYARVYTYAPFEGTPYMYVYGPAFGWTWVVAPWIWGWGPEPWFGVFGGPRFTWWGHGWGSGWRGPRPTHPFRAAPGFHPSRPGPGFRPGHPAPAFRPMRPAPARPGFGAGPDRGWRR